MTRRAWILDLFATHSAGCQRKLVPGDSGIRLDGQEGKLAIEFAITRNGQVAGMKLIATSGDDPWDRAAWAGITASNPFPPLPGEFTGPYLALRFRFYYNPDKADLQ